MASSLFNLSGIPARPLAFASVPHATAPGNISGDIDVLLCPRTQPELATAISVKRIKCRTNTSGSVTINKLQELRKASEQANKLAEIGFHLVYSFVLAAIDTREQNTGEKTSYRGLPAEIEQRVRSAVEGHDLAQRVGLCRTEFVQSMDGSPLRSGTSEICLLRNATAVPQAESLTEWVSRVMLREEAVEEVLVPAPLRP